MPRKWKKLARLTNAEGDGHRIFKEKGTHVSADGVACFEGGVYAALADNSGRYPEDTDDGILWLDPCQPLRLCRGSSGLDVRVPLIDDGNSGRGRGDETCTMTSIAGGAELLELFPSWTIEASPELGPLIELIAIYIGPAWIRNLLEKGRL